MDDKEFIAQLAQFSSLEQLTNISGNMDTIVANQKQAAMGDAVGLIGKQVSATGYTLSKTGSDVSTLYYYTDTTITSGYINVYDKDYNLVYTEVLSAKQGGTMHKFNWNGKNYSNEDVADGLYTVGMAGEDANGEAVYIQMEVDGVVDGVVTDDSTTYLVLEDGRYVDYTLVGQISQPKNTNTDSTNTDSTDETDNTDETETTDNTDSTDSSDTGSGDGESSDNTEESITE
jgi:flagellar basal-body rod modification protein FlgD